MSSPHDLGKHVTTGTGEHGRIVDRRQNEAGAWIYGVAHDGRSPIAYYLAEGIGPGTFRGMSNGG